MPDAPGVRTFEVNRAGFIINQRPVGRPLFFVRATSGPAGVPVLITGWDDYRAIFGERISGDYSYDEVYQFFRLGIECYIVRVIDGTAAIATGTLNTLGVATNGTLTSTIDPLFPVALAPGDNIEFDSDLLGGSTAVTVAATQAADITVENSGAFVAPAVGDTMVFEMNGDGVSQQVTFAGPPVTMQDVVDQINAQIYGAVATFVDAAVSVSGNDEIHIVSSLLGTDSEVDYTADTLTGSMTASPLNDAPGVGDFADYSAVTYAEFKAVVEAALGAVNVTVNPAGAASWSIQTNTAGAGGWIQCTVTGAMGPKIGMLAGAAVAGGTLTLPLPTMDVEASYEGDFANTYDVIATRRDLYSGQVSADLPVAAARQFNMVSTHNVAVGDVLRVRDSAAPTNYFYCTVRKISGPIVYTEASFTPPVLIPAATSEVHKLVFDLEVDDQGDVVHNWVGLSMSPTSPSYCESAVNSTDPNRKIQISIISPAPAIDNRPDGTIQLAGGDDGGIPLAADYTALWPSLEKYKDFDEAYNPAIMSYDNASQVSWARSLEGEAADRKDFLGIVIPHEVGGNPWTSAQLLKEWKEGSSGGGPALFSTFVALYYPWVKVEDPISSAAGALVTVPCGGSVLGAFQYNDREATFGKAPANRTGILPNALGITAEYSDPERGELNNAGICIIKKVRNRGIRIFGARTAGLGDFMYVNIRRGFIRMRKDIDEGLQDAPFENNDARTRAEITRVIENYLYNRWKEGVLMGENSEDAYYVICDETNNPPSVAESGKLIVRVGLAMATPGEFIEVYFERDRRALNEELGLQQLT